MKKSLLLTALILTLGSFTSVQANDVTDIYEKLNNDLKETRSSIQQEGLHNVHTFSQDAKGTLSIQRNVIRPTRGEIAIRKDSSHIRRNIESDKQLDYAIQQRQKRSFYKKYVRTSDAKNRLNQIGQHNAARSTVGATQQATSLKRTGEFKDVPNYPYRRHFSEPSSIRKNEKQVFRRRVQNYYFEGGDAGTEALNDDVIKSSEHTVSRNNVPTAKVSKAQGDVVSRVRDLQKRSFRTLNKVPTGYQRQTRQRQGSYSRNYTNPYQFQYLPE